MIASTLKPVQLGPDFVQNIMVVGSYVKLQAGALSKLATTSFSDQTQRLKLILLLLLLS